MSLASRDKSNSLVKLQRINRLRGFTLLELMIVLVLLGVLAGIAVPTYMGRADAARIQKVDADFSTIATALSLYKLDNSTLPTTGQGLAALVTKPQLDPIPLRYKSGGYINDLPLDPWNRAYLYLNPARSSEREYDLYTLGADGKTGGDGQDADIAR